MSRLGVIGGQGILAADLMSPSVRVESVTPYGPVVALARENCVVVQRHGLDEFRSAPFVNHRANVWALTDLGCDRVLGLGSVGSLRGDLAVGSFLSPDDFIAFHLGLSFSDTHTGYQTPGFASEWRRRVVEVWASTTDVSLLDGGVYWQTIGPRFETPAEVRFIAAHADVVGMTIASECVLAGEVGLPYAAICVIDNLANGLSAAPLSLDEFDTGTAANRGRLVGALKKVLPRLADSASGPDRASR